MESSMLDRTDGLANNNINCITQDPWGFIWIGTNEGLNRYDGFEIDVFRHVLKDPNSINNNKVTALKADSKGKVWIGTPTGLNYYDPEFDKIFQVNKSKSRNETHSSFPINLIHILDSTSLLLGSPDGLYRYNILTSKQSEIPFPEDHVTIKQILTIGAGQHLLNTSKGIFLYHNDKIEKYSLGEDTNPITSIKFLYLDRFDHFWAIIEDEIVIYNRRQHEQKKIIFPDHPNMSQICEDAKGYIWISTKNNGLLRIKNKGLFTQINSLEQYSKGKSENNYYTLLFQANDQSIWSATSPKGLEQIRFIDKPFKLIRKTEGTANTISDNWVRGICKDHQGFLWICSNKGLDRYDENTNTWKHYKDNGEGSLNSSHVNWAAEDDLNNLWIATQKGLNLYNREKDHFISIPLPNDPNKIKSQDILQIFCDDNGVVWLICNNGTIFYKNVKSSNPEYLRLENKAYDRYLETNKSNEFRVIHRDKKNMLWVSGYNTGLYRIDLASKKVKKYSKSNNSSIYQHSSIVFTIAETTEGNIFFGTTNGIYKYNRKNDSFRNFTSWNGLSSNGIFGIIADQNQDLWVGTNNNLTRFNSNKHDSKIFEIKESGRVNVFTKGVFYDKSTHEIFMGTNSGFISFFPNKLSKDEKELPVFITGFFVENQKITPQSKVSGNIVMEGPLNETGLLKLKHHMQDIRIRFTHPRFIDHHSIKYQYRLNPLDKNWQQAGYRQRSAAYSQLSPGNYTFKVRATNINGKWIEPVKQLKITIATPPWKTWWAILIYIVVFIALTLILLKRYSLRKQQKRAQEEEQLKLQNIQEVNKMKLQFFTNISHELRTPLSLIIGPLEDIMLLLKEKDLPSDSIDIASRNAHHMLRLVNQLLDFRKAEMGKLKYTPKVGDLRQTLHQCFDSFRWMARENAIHYNDHSGNESLWMTFDEDLLEKSLFNLLSNAFKYTPRAGNITIKLYREIDQIGISVNDNGEGISQEELTKIFDRYYQGENHKPGTGVGLSLVQELAGIQQGKIEVKSEKGKGSEFILWLPYQELDTPEEKEHTEAPTEEHGELNKDRILIVEDNPELRKYIFNALSGEYHVLKAENGKEALEIIQTESIDLVVSDVMMPEMDGKELCKIIKSDIQTSHIAVVLLTSLSETEEKIAGLEAGADSYITKPFSMSYLKTRIAGLIAKRKTMQQNMNDNLLDKTSNSNLNKLDQEFLDEIKTVVLDNIDNPQLDVNYLTDKLGVSRSLLHLKLKKLSGQSAGEFVRNIRLSKAAELLSKGYNVSEAAYQTGFTDPRYFSTSFKKKYNVSPSKYLK